MEIDFERDFDYYQGVATSSYGDMLHDDERNQKYGLALKKAIEKVHARGQEAHVLDIGAGTGLLSMLAVRHGADTVVACEASEPVAKCAGKIIEANGFSSRIKLIPKHSSDLTVGEDGDLPRKANILVTEIFDTELIGEAAIIIFNHAHDALLESDSIVIPSVGTVYGQIIESPSLLRWHRLEDWCDGDQMIVPVPEAAKTCAGTAGLFDFQLSQLPKSEFTALTEPITLFQFDFMRSKPLATTEYKSFNLKLTADGKAQAVFTWWDLIMDDDGDILLSCAPVWHHPDGPKILPDGNPAMDIPWRDHWMQAAYFFRIEQEIEKTTTLRAYHDEFSYWFALCPCKNGCTCRAEQLPACDCMLHITASRTRFAAINCPNRRSKLLKLAKELVKKKRIFIILGDFSLLGILLCKLGAQQVYIVTDSDCNVSHRVFEEFMKSNHCNQAKFSTLEQVVENLRKDPQQVCELAIVAEPFYASSILPWDNGKFTLALRDFFKLTEDFIPKDQILISPNSFEIQACCVKFDDLWKISQPIRKCMGFDVSFFDQLISNAKHEAEASPEAQPLWEYPGKALSHPVTVLSWSSKNLNEPINKVIEFSVESGDDEVNGIAFWVEYTMLPGIKISNGPIHSPEIGKYITWDRCERQGVHLYEIPPRGSKLPCRVKFDPETSVVSFNFHVISK